MSDQGNGVAADGGRRRRYLTVIVSAAALSVADFVALTWGVPIADEMTTNPYMSLGYVLTFGVMLANFIVILMMVAYIFHEDSYPSDRWT